jgi:hypothetical protein
VAWGPVRDMIHKCNVCRIKFMAIMVVVEVRSACRCHAKKVQKKVQKKVFEVGFEPMTLGLGGRPLTN